MSPSLEPKRELLRHTLATVAYRGGKTVRNVPETFATFRVGEKSRTPVQILAHIGDLLDWALSLAKGAQAWHDSAPNPWKREITRFFEGLERLDQYLGSDAPLKETPERLFQGPIADALSHIGQIAMLRRLAGAPVKGENYHKAKIASGQVGQAQPPAVMEFD
jgi:hypothetical protein